MSKAVIVVDDEAFVRDSLIELLSEQRVASLAASSGEEALRLVETESVGAMVTDLRMPAMDGLRLLQEVRRLSPQLPVIVLTGAGTVAEAVEAMKRGAFDFIQKPVDPEQFILLVERALEHRELVHRVEYLQNAVADLRGSSDMVGPSQALATVRELIVQVAPTGATVLVMGESGSGKELVAAEIHRSSPRAQGNLVRVNCAAIPESLFESEFFGHRRGAFTSAVADRAGRFAEAEGGTIVLDEIGTLRPEMQAKLLRVLESGEYQVVGESRFRIADVRVVASTNEDLAALVRTGAFRKDLFYRLNVFPIRVPPLRERKEDIVPIARFILERLVPRRRQAGAAEPLQRDAEEVLIGYDWPGNVRELRNVLERALILSAGASIDAPLLRRILAAAGAAPSFEAGDDPADLQIRRRVDALERRLILEALARTGNRKRDAAGLLGIDPKNLGYYLKKHGLSDPSAPGDEGST